MQVSLDKGAVPSPSLGFAVVSLGVFDGVHLGHQAILKANVDAARRRGAVPTVVTFAAHPKAVLLGRGPRTLTTLAHRLELFERAGIEHAVALPFDEALRDTPARVFVEEFLVKSLEAKHFVLGFDSQFGADRGGNAQLLRDLGHSTEVVPKVEVDLRAVSSTAIREAVELGDLAMAARMLGRRVSVLGEVVPGAQLGRKLGFPTANLDLHHELHPPVGVYACLAHVLRAGSASDVAETRKAVCNVGFRPTVDGSPPVAPIVEAHLLDFEGDLYGERLELEFVAALRGEQKFEGLDALKDQIARDVADARECLRAEVEVPA